MYFMSMELGKTVPRPCTDGVEKSQWRLGSEPSSMRSKTEKNGVTPQNLLSFVCCMLCVIIDLYVHTC